MPGSTNQTTPAGWDLAREFYVKHFAGRSLLFDSKLVEINDWLATQADYGSSLDSSGPQPDLAMILRSAAENYQSKWTTANSKNQLWIKTMEPQVVAIASTAVPLMEADFGMPWPHDPLRVDVSYEVHEIGEAYTTDHPPHTTISSSSPQNQGVAGLEILFHEAAHTMSRKIERALASECSLQKKECGDLWHALLFYTVGDVIKRSLPSAEQQSFTPYAYRFGLYNHRSWAIYRVALEKDWQPYLDGRAGFDSAIRALVTDL